MCLVGPWVSDYLTDSNLMLVRGGGVYINKTNNR